MTDVDFQAAIERREDAGYTSPSRLTKPPGWRVNGCASVSTAAKGSRVQDSIDVFAIGTAFGQAPELTEMHIDRQVAQRPISAAISMTRMPQRANTNLRMGLDAANNVEIGVADFTVASMSTPSGL